VLRQTPLMRTTHLGDVTTSSLLGLERSHGPSPRCFFLAYGDQPSELKESVVVGFTAAIRQQCDADDPFQKSPPMGPCQLERTTDWTPSSEPPKEHRVYHGSESRSSLSLTVLHFYFSRQEKSQF
jgi:hypothetical protein